MRRRYEGIYQNLFDRTMLCDIRRQGSLIGRMVDAEDA
jgi:hypothetical protein